MFTKNIVAQRTKSRIIHDLFTNHELLITLHLLTINGHDKQTTTK